MLPVPVSCAFHCMLSTCTGPQFHAPRSTSFRMLRHHGSWSVLLLCHEHEHIMGSWQISAFCVVCFPLRPALLHRAPPSSQLDILILVESRLALSQAQRSH